MIEIRGRRFSSLTSEQCSSQTAIPVECKGSEGLSIQQTPVQTTVGLFSQKLQLRMFYPKFFTRRYPTTPMKDRVVRIIAD